VVIRLAGESGEGVISSGDILTQAAARGGYYTQTFRTFPAEIKGGPCMYQFRLSDEPIWSHGKDVDLLVCFNQEAWDLNWDSLGPEGVILYDISEVAIPDEYLPRARPVRMEELAKEIGGSLRAKNMVAVGAVTGVIEFDTTPIEELVLRRYAHKEGVADANIAALHAGADEAADLKGRYPLVAPVETDGQWLQQWELIELSEAEQEAYYRQTHPPRWIEFWSALPDEVDELLEAAGAVKRRLEHGLSVGLGQAAQGDSRVFLGSWQQAKALGLIPPELVAGVQALAVAFDLPAEFIGGLE
jgi:Pyruvate/2-oxoacid:ferredoxin oxidoreductase gamma subunit